MKKPILPVLFLYNIILFPNCNQVVTIPIRRGRKIKKGDRLVVVTITRNIWRFFFPFILGTKCEIVEYNNERNECTVQLHGLERVKVASFLIKGFVSFESVKIPKAVAGSDGLVELKRKAQEMVFLIDVPESEKLIQLLNYIIDYNQLVDFITHYFIKRQKERDYLYREFDPDKRGVWLSLLLDDLIEDIKKKEKK